MSLTVGTRLGPYEILAPLGVAGWGRSIGRGTRLDRTVAIKVLPQHLSASPEVRQRFEREAKTISQLSHPHIRAPRKAENGKLPGFTAFWRRTIRWTPTPIFSKRRSKPGSTPAAG